MNELIAMRFQNETSGMLRMHFMQLEGKMICLLLPKEVRDYLLQEDDDYWERGDHELFKMLYPEWYPYIAAEVQNSPPASRLQ